MLIPRDKKEGVMFASSVVTVVSTDPDDFRDKLPSSGIFEMLDCEVEFFCPPYATPEDVQRMVNTVESMINVVDARISSTPEDLHRDTYKVIITEVPVDVAKRFNRPSKKD